MSQLERAKLDYYVACVNEFAAYHMMKSSEAGKYLLQYGGIDFLCEFYDVEHTLSFDETVEALTSVCSRNGGRIS